MRREDLLDLNEAIQNPGKRLHFQVTTELPNEADLDLLAPVTGELHAVSTGNVLLLEGDFETTCVLECARCGCPLQVKVAYEMDDQFPVDGVPSCYASGSYAKVAAEEDFPLFQNDNSLIKDTYIRQGLLINIPVQPLCEHGWDKPCPNADAAEAERREEGHGHPAFKTLRQLREDAEETP